MNSSEKLERIEVLKREAKRLKGEVDYYNALQLALKLVLNGTYGAISTPYFILFNNNVASSITAQGRELTQRMNDDNRDYWYNMWHLDYELHQKLGISDVKKVSESDETSIYADTDSVSGKSIIRTDRGVFTIEELYNMGTISAGETIMGHQSVEWDGEVLNYSGGELVYHPVNRIIRHRVSKPKWLLKTKSGKSVEITDCHSMIVFRNGHQIEVKPSQILMSDKILSVYE